MVNALRKVGIVAMSLALLAVPASAGNGEQVRQRNRDGSCGNCPPDWAQVDCPRYGYGIGCGMGMGWGRGWRGGQGQGQGRGLRLRMRQGRCLAQAPAQDSQVAKPAPAKDQPAK